MVRFKQVFGKLRDPRAQNAQHELLEIVVIALAAVLCGAEGAADMARFGRSKAGVLRLFLPLKHGIPSHDTFSRVFRLLDPEGFERAFRQFLKVFARHNKLALTGCIAIDGKSSCHAYERGKSATPIHLVNAFAAEARIALASRKAPRRNESEAALEVLQMLELEGNIVTADALFCSRPFASVVLQKEGDYVLALKKNQHKLFAAVERCFARGGPRSNAKQIEPFTHDRRESRRATVIRNTALADAHKFPGIKAVARVISRRRLHGTKALSPYTRYYLLSKYLPAKTLLNVVRGHWSIENQLHWLLDVVLKEDADRARKDHAPENLAILRKLALNVLRAHPEKISMRQKVKSAAWDDKFLLSLIAHMR